MSRPTKIQQTIDQLRSSSINNAKSSLYDNAFDELCGWLKDLLYTGVLVPMVNVQEKYREVLQLRNETVMESMLRTSSIRDRLITKFGEKVLFTKINNLN